MSGPTPSPSPEPTTVVSTPHLGYGLPNWWATQDPRAFAALLKTHGLGQTIIELRPSSHGEQEPPPAITAAFLQAMRSSGITVLIHVVNWNCRGTCPSLAEIEASVARLSALGTSSMILEVAEPDRAPDRGMAIHSLAVVRAGWSGDLAINFGHGGESTVPWQWRDFHECDPNPEHWAIRGDAIHTTDCRGTLTANAGGIGAWAKRTGQRIILYDFQAHTPDLGVLAELREAH